MGLVFWALGRQGDCCPHNKWSNVGLFRFLLSQTNKTLSWWFHLWLGFLILYLLNSILSVIIMKIRDCLSHHWEIFIAMVSQWALRRWSSSGFWDEDWSRVLDLMVDQETRVQALYFRAKCINGPGSRWTHLSPDLSLIRSEEWLELKLQVQVGPEFTHLENILARVDPFAAPLMILGLE